MSEPPADRFRLYVLGAPDLRAPDGRRLGSILAQPKRLGLLTYLALAPEPVPRATVIATFWPESDEARARNALSQALFHLRRALEEDVVESVEGDRLWASPERIWCDARELLADPRPATAVGDLLGGWTPEDAPPLQEWLDEQRGRIRARAESKHPAERTPPPSTQPEPALDRRPPAHVDPAPPDLARPHGARLHGARPRFTRLGRVTLLAGGLAAVALVAVSLATDRLGGRSSPQELAVLLPRVTRAAGAVDLSPQVILDEVLAHLPHRDDVRIIPAPSASTVPDFRTQLATIGTPLEDAPDWILEVSVRVASGEARVVGLLYRTPAFDVPGRESFGVAYAAADRALLEVPREIARGVAAMVERTLVAR